MLPNQDTKLSSDSIVAKHMQGKHDQSTHSHGKGGMSIKPAADIEATDTELDVAMTAINNNIESAKRSTSADFPYKEESKIRSAIDRAYQSGGDVSSLRSLNEKYDNKRYGIQLKMDEGRATDFDNENFNAWGDLTAATGEAIRAFGEEPDYE